ncbi:uncharacterized protein LACBIDRAFT_294772 [Laccaria bicolor S238N-H82]|uniref:Predicted protein n=1 Tax=Laccaria bicolor (strain S238N-H82 / ATCC MYA-4686) TaxID=486041 RepID=B0DHX1_LACBS|nr:uncharacterized protein LACBIDRAFT_294772 [Laccaria bicolor S238N-H82]EDR05803.1 predicted protein [Laccaria bicolor S238N-H82]|eukprot:XP_001883479.1 predicted protein [Laccaria bicolor S238N-H82]
MPATTKKKAQLHPTTKSKTNGKSQHANKAKPNTHGKSHPTTKSKPKTQLQHPQKHKTNGKSHPMTKPKPKTQLQQPQKKSKPKDPSPQPAKKSNTKTQPAQAQQPTALIVVLGRIGVGKSSFINTLAGNDALRVGHSTERETRRPLLVEVSPPHSDSKATIALLDTPGIDGDRPDSANKILKYVDAWLKRNRKGNVYFGGFLVLEESQAIDRPEPLSLLASVRCQSSLVLTKLGYGPHNNGHLHNSTNGIVFDPPTRERAWQIVNEILGRSTGAASVRLHTGLVFKNILREIKKRTPSAMSRILALFCIGEEEARKR